MSVELSSFHKVTEPLRPSQHIDAIEILFCVLTQGNGMEDVVINDHYQVRLLPKLSTLCYLNSEVLKKDEKR